MRKLLESGFWAGRTLRSHPPQQFADLTGREAEAVIEGLTVHQSRLLDNDPYAHGISVDHLLGRIGEQPPPEPVLWVWHEIDLPLLDWKLVRGRENLGDAYRLLADIACSIGAVPGMVNIGDGYCWASKFGLRVTFVVASPVPSGGLLLLSVETVGST
ncbi:hypothetical protein [Candidatus Poriferisocius sp.]|uniref:hypothetical protein n=1 Tax=Candidatus Poriferisocius sp. TaxID=3101276 RepID=UPI003B52CA10